MENIDQINQIGNAVTPPFITQVFRYIKVISTEEIIEI